MRLPVAVTPPGSFKHGAGALEVEAVLLLIEAEFSCARVSLVAGDWNGDGLFDQRDIVAALQAGDYLRER